VRAARDRRPGAGAVRGVPARAAAVPLDGRDILLSLTSRTGRQTLTRAAVSMLFAIVVAIVLANFAVYFVYAYAMPGAPDPEAGRLVQIQVGGHLWVYVTQGEALLHALVRRLLLVGLTCAVAALWLSQGIEPRDARQD